MKDHVLHWMVALLLPGMLLASCAQRPPEESGRMAPVPRETIQAEMWLDKPCGATYRQDEKVIVNFRLSADGYVVIYGVDTAGITSVLFPNEHDPDNLVQGGEMYAFPNPTYSYDLVVDGPPGIEYIDIVASTDPYYHWNYNQEEPEWVDSWGLTRRNFRELALEEFELSPEYQNRPQLFREEWEQPMATNYAITRQVREQVTTQLAEHSREPDVKAYSTASCYFYVIESSR